MTIVRQRTKITIASRVASVGARKLTSAVIAGVLSLLIVAGCSHTVGSGNASVSQSCVSPKITLEGKRAPNTIITPVESQTIKEFRLLRRSRAASDIPTATMLYGGTLSRELAKDYDLSGYYSEYVRRLPVNGGGRAAVFVVPGLAQVEVPPPRRCLPARVWREISEKQRRRASDIVYCIIEQQGGKTVPLTDCATFVGINEGGSIFSAPLRRDRIVELVPDGIRVVRITYPNGNIVSSWVHENTMWFIPPLPSHGMVGELEILQRRLYETAVTPAERRRLITQYDRVLAQNEPTKIEWYDRAGRRVRVITNKRKRADVGNLRAPIKG